MSSTADHYKNLFNRLLEGELSPEQTDDLVAWLGKENPDTEASELIATRLQRSVDSERISPELISTLAARLPAILAHRPDSKVIDTSGFPFSESAGSKNATQTPSGKSVHFLRGNFVRYAAAALIILLGSFVYFLISNTDKNAATTNISQQIQTDIAPGGEKAVLTLADGSKIILDSTATGNLAQQGNAQVVKLASGQIAYHIKGEPGDKKIWNTMSTPAGGQYQIILPDGTKVWLNAASSITYPAVFIGKERLVKISGEVYFEVARNRQKPFLVEISGKSLLEVIGTSFNINSYANEEDIKTTLLEGIVKVKTDDHSVILKPGQQAVQVLDATNARPGGHSLKVVNADTTQALAWKNGLFNFNGANLPAVMHQLERWYDITVRYEGSVPKTKFSGEIYRNVNLSDVLEALQRMGVKYRLQGKTLVII